ncbi:MAG TPA: peptide-methionine (S)-S-oxide reductase, partial [Longimicrobiales bacterium]|nr:peptide-methionine (S)-S-oxide reductase [Longimicrobiales bacterium]
DEEQGKVARAYIAKLQKFKAFKKKIVTQVAPLKAFFDAEAYHQNYMEHHPFQPYIVYNDRPKVDNLKKAFPALYRE